MQNLTTTLQDALDTRFFAPLRRPCTRRVGVELEFPIWNRTSGKVTDFDAVHAATEEFLARFDFPDTALDDSGALYRVRDRATMTKLVLGLDGFTVASGAHCKTYNEDIVSVPLKMDDEIRVGFIRRSGIPLSAEGAAFVSVVRNKFAEPSAKPAK